MEAKCWTCCHGINIPGDCHVSCAKSDKEMTGNPTWMTKDCSNYEEKASKTRIVKVGANSFEYKP